MNTNKKALVLSSTRGIGYAICKQFAEMGHDVILHGRSESSVKSAIEKINSHNGQQKVSGLNADLYNKREVSNLTESTCAFRLLSRSRGCSMAEQRLP